MSTRTWNGLVADWNTGADWTPTMTSGFNVPLPGDTAVIASGTVVLTTNGAAGNGLFENNQINLGGSAGATLLLRNPRAIGRALNITIAGSATIEADGSRGFAASITGQPNDGSTITLKADPGGNLTLLNGGTFNVADRTIDFEGHITLERDAKVAGNIVNNGTLSILSGTTTFATNSLTGTGTIEIGGNARLFVSGFQFSGASQTIAFSGFGGTLGLAYNTPQNFAGTIRDFAAGDFIDFVGNGAVTSQSLDTIAHTLTIGDSSGATYVFNNVYGAAGTLKAVHQSNGHDLIGYTTAEPQLDYQIDASARAMHADVAQGMTIPGTDTLITGAGVKVGIISNSFNVNGGAAVAIASGYLPAGGVTVLREGAAGSTDEGQAMAELIHQVAPGATLCFAATGSGVNDFASSVQALQAAGCTVIVDDVGFGGGEPFFQLGSAAETAISAAVASGVTYVTSAGNFGDAVYQHAFAATQQTLADGSSVQAMTFSNGTPYQGITAIGGLFDTIDLQWDAPFYGTGGVASDQPDSIVFKVFDATTNALIGTSTQVSVDGHRVAESELSLPFSSSNTAYNIAIYHADGTPVVSEIKYVISGVSSKGAAGVGGRINDPDAGTGSGAIDGHALVPGVITVAAMDVTNTSAFGRVPDSTEAFSSTGPGTLLFDPSGARYAQPVTSGSPDVTGPDGSQTSVTGFTPFYGTSAAAPNVAGVAALLQQLQPGISPASVASILVKSALPLTGEPSSVAGAGLVQADRAILLAAVSGLDAHDSASVTANAATLKADGYTFVAQYIDQDDDPNNTGQTRFTANGPSGGSMTAAQAAADLAAGLQIVSIFETNGMGNTPYDASVGSYTSQQIIGSYLSTAQGLTDGTKAVASAQAIGQPAGTAIYFAMDFDTGPPGYIAGAQIALENYFKGIAQALAGSGYKIGVYGAGQTLQWLTTADASNGYTPQVSSTWLSQSTGWAGYDINATSGPTHGWSLIQGNTTTAPNTAVPIDPDTAKSASFGGWATATVSVADFVTNQTILDTIAAGFSVTDTAANVAGHQALLEADPHVARITAKGATTTAVETFNIQGQSYTSTIYTSDLAGNLLSARYGGVKSQAYQSFESDYRYGVATGTQYFYTGITGKPYTTETLSVNAAGQQTAVAFGGVTGQPYSSYQYTYSNGLFAGSTFTYTSVPAGATYSSYATDYNFGSTYQGVRFNYTNISGQSYTGEEVDTTPAGVTTRVLLTGFTGQPYQSLELDYTAGSYTGYKTFATGITGQSYSGLETDVTAAGQLTKVIYTGLKTTPYTMLEQAYAGGTPSTSTFTFNAPAGQSYSGYTVTQNAVGAQISETVDNRDGSHTILGSAPNLIFESIGNDTITGGGSGETFAFHDVFGHDTLTDFFQHTTGGGHDTIDLSTADFTSFASLSNAAQNVSGGVTITGKSGSALTLLGLDKTTLAGLGADFTFHA